MSPREHLQQHSIVSMNHCLYKLTSLANAVLDVTDKFPPNPLTKAHANIWLAGLRITPIMWLSPFIATPTIVVSSYPRSECSRSGRNDPQSILPAGSWEWAGRSFNLLLTIAWTSMSFTNREEKQNWTLWCTVHCLCKRIRRKFISHIKNSICQRSAKVCTSNGSYSQYCVAAGVHVDSWSTSWS